MAYTSEIAKLTMLGTGLQQGTLHWWVALFMSNSSVMAEPLKHNIAAYSALHECDSGGSYARKQITSSVVVTALGNGLVKVSADSPIWTALAASSLPIACALVYLDTTGTNADATNFPLFCDTVSFPRTPTGADFPWLIPAAGFLNF